MNLWFSARIMTLIEPTDAELREVSQRCIEKGRQLHEELKSWNETDVLDYASMQELYSVSKGYLDTPNGILEELKSMNVNPASMLWVDITSKKKHSDTAYSHRANGRDGFLMIWENKKSNDVNELGKRLFPSEIGWQTFLMAAKEDGQKEGSTNIRVILNYFIVNEEVLQAIHWANRNSHSARDGENGHREYSENDDGFYAILGSALGACNMRMLIDHKASTGYRFVDRVIVLEDDLGTKYQRGRSFMIVLSERRQRPAQSA